MKARILQQASATPSRNHKARTWRPTLPMVAIGLLLCIAVAFGGGGMRYALANLVVQLAALIVMAVRSDSVSAFWREAPLFLRVMVGLSILIPLFQIIPLPETVWSALPGRNLVQQSFELSGNSGWAPASVDPVRTTVALTGLIAPLAVLAAGWSLPRAQLIALGWVIVILAIGNFLIGIPQVISGGSSAVIYDRMGAEAVLSGTFANRNSTGIFFVTAMLLAALVDPPRPHRYTLLIRIGIIAILLVAVVLTRSRTALVLAAIPLALAAIRAFAWSRGAELAANPSRTKALVISAIALGIGAIATTAIVAPGRVGETVERFQATDDARRYIWEDSAYSASRYWPVGAGMGTFDEVFQVDESLEHATQRRAGRAHNDYLEVAIEAGAPGLAMIALWLALTGWFAWKARRSQSRWSAWAAAGILLAIALQSITDYPLRNQTMLATASFALLLLARISASREEVQR